MEDYLDQDPEIRGQKYVCLSFISPEDVIKNKEVYMFEKYIQSFSQDVKAFIEGNKEYFKDNREVLESLNMLEQRYDMIINPVTIVDDFNFFKHNNGDKLEHEYLEKNELQTTVRGIKVRGTYETLGEAQKRAQTIAKFDKNFNIYVAEVGCWCPWSPNPDQIEDSEYANTQLNTMMKSYKETQELKTQFYNLRAEEMVKKAQEAAAENKQEEVSVIVEDKVENLLGEYVEVEKSTE